MPQAVYLNTPIDPTLKHKAEAILQQMGVSTTDAITDFFKEIVANKGIPFCSHVPNDETINAMKEDHRKLPTYTNSRDMINDILAD